MVRISLDKRANLIQIGLDRMSLYSSGNRQAGVGVDLLRVYARVYWGVAKRRDRLRWFECICRQQDESGWLKVLGQYL